jgi:hypothetical protein
VPRLDPESALPAEVDHFEDHADPGRQVLIVIERLKHEISRREVDRFIGQEGLFEGVSQVQRILNNHQPVLLMIAIPIHRALNAVAGKSSSGSNHCPGRTAPIGFQP